ncbi:MAG: phenylalanine--tRNA ligase subunit alpha [Candidatus Moraniibacteriota bacterium]
MTLERLEIIKKEALEALAQVKDETGLSSWENTYLGRKSEFNTLLRGVKDLSPEERKKVGATGNAIKRELFEAFEIVKKSSTVTHQSEGKERIDVTLPGVGDGAGHLHPITRIEQEIEDIFSSMGFSVADGPEVESEWYNFDALNFPLDHPARDMQDAFWLADSWGRKKYLPRTHTSSVQVRYMETHKPPFQIIIPGRIFRNEATDASHEHTFHQFECLVVGDDISVANFKSVAEIFFTAFFKRETTVRLRPSFFPFTEPSFEFDVNCLLCNGRGCSVCKGTGWLEIGGAGMVHQNVFEAAGYKRGQYQGFAWGFGLTRLAMMKYKISDIRLLMSGDLRFIRQF